MGPASLVESEPSGASELLGVAIDQARRYAADLAAHGERLGLIGPQESARLWSRHILNSALLAPLLWSGARVGDVGSGAGLPGIVLAIARPDVRLVLIEPMERRAMWLRNETAALGLTNVDVVRARAQEAGALGVDQLTARAVSSLTKLLPLVVPLVRVGGELLLFKGASAARELADAAQVVRRLNLSDARISEIGDGVAVESTRVFRATVV